MNKTTVNAELSMIMLLIVIMGCKKPYSPRLAGSTTSNLVVEGTINTGTDSTIIRLSRTVPLNSTAGSTPELGAAIAIISKTGTSYALAETGKGFYEGPGLDMAGTSNTFGLKITTADGKIYQSDLVQAKNSPPFDSVYYRLQNNGLQIYSDSHDPANNTRYYLYSYNETWEFHSEYDSDDYFSPIDDTVLNRLDPRQRVYICWQSDTSSDILLNSTAKLSRDVISENPVTFLASHSDKVADRYSILVKQYALTLDAYNYYQQLKKNTESIGSIFDAQPSELPGNIHCLTNPSEAVLGYVTAGSPSESRIFIDNRNLPTWDAFNPYTGCKLDTDRFVQPIGSGGTVVNNVLLNIHTGVHIPIGAYQPPPEFFLLGYVSSNPFCVDCTLRGTNIQPAFWIN